MHSYDPSPQPFQSQIPSMRPSRDGSPGHSATPIYDALYSEYLRAFRTLPGDRSGEEDLDFRGFGTGMHSGRGGLFGYGSHTGQTGQTSDHPGHTGHSAGQLNSSGQQRGWHPHQTGRHAAHQPAALPPAPRKGV
ncbi:hypothetical protein OGH68_07565 [Streptomyces peucetius]|uniref:Uncharacterized protein n=2 Tax=Streptomyces peucetius TaxID=1950 RepID=A0ABY6I2Z0_STRPE|nr:hypothetical protein OGH68_07565 [Streptomyces peucetius]